MASKSPPQPLRLANLFAKVPHIADLVVRELEPSDVEDLLMNTDPALSSFCNGSGGGIDHFIDISTRAHQERKRLRKLPSLPRLLEEEWRKRLVGKKMIAEHLQSDEMTFKRSDIPEPNRIGQTSRTWEFRKNRLNIDFDKGEVTHVWYG